MALTEYQTETTADTGSKKKRKKKGYSVPGYINKSMAAKIRSG